MSEKYDKSKWGPGPWQDEPDRVLWVDEATGLDCLARRAGPFGHWCGYVGVPSSHPWAKIDHFDNVPAEVHGGITYRERCDGDPVYGVCHPKPHGEDDTVWIGFDCAHYCDYSPGMAALMSEVVGSSPWSETTRGFQTYKDLAFVRSEIESLARQARSVTA